MNIRYSLQNQSQQICIQVPISSSQDIFMEEDCHICKNSLNLEDRYPVQLCQNKHQCCIKCFQQICQKQNPLCPFCRIQVPKAKIYQRIVQAQQTRDKKKCHMRKLEMLQSMDKISSLTQKSKNAIIWREYRKIRQVQGFPVACRFLKEHILEDLNLSGHQSSIQDKPIMKRITNDEEFVGLGSNYQQQGFSEQFGYDWYQKKYNLAEISLYDQLAIVCIIQKRKQQGWCWYHSIIQKSPSNFKAVLGMAHCCGKPEKESLILSSPYQRVIELKPEFDKPYEIIAFMYLELKVLSKAVKYANECLKRNPNNIFAEYILAVSDSNLPSQQKQQKLLNIVDKEPTFVRAQHAFGKQHSNIGKHKQAIKCYEKCLQTNQHYLFPIIDWAISLINLSENKAAIELLQKWYQRLRNDNNLSQDFNYYRGVAYQNMGDLQKAIDSLLQGSFFNDRAAIKLGNLYFELSNWDKALRYYNVISNFKDGECKLSISLKASQCCDQKGLYKLEIEWLNKWFSLDPTPEVHVKLAKCYMKDKCYVGCISWSKMCIEKNFNPQVIYPIIIQALYINKEHKQSLTYIEQYRQRFSLSSQQTEWLLNLEMKNFYGIQQILRNPPIKDK